MERYSKLEKIGEGTYGVVYKARVEEGPHEGSFVALKRIKTEDDGVPGATIREIAALQELHHENIVSMLDLIQQKSFLYLVFEYLHKDLYSYLLQLAPSGISYPLVKSYMQQLFSGVSYCHVRRVLHRDLKPQNLLIDPKGTIKLADFGLTREVGLGGFRTYTQEVVTLWYRAPEILLGADTYSSAIDLWSLGCIFVEMVVNCPLFPGDSDVGQLMSIFQLLGTPHPSSWPEIEQLPAFQHTVFPYLPPHKLEQAFPGICAQGIDLLSRLIEYNPIKRLTAREAERHSLFADRVTDVVAEL